MVQELHQVVPMHLFISLMIAAQLGWAAPTESVKLGDTSLCASLLAPSFSEMKLTVHEAIEIQKTYFNALGIPADPRADQGLLQWMNIDPAQHSEIVLFSLNNFFGDSLIFHFSMLDYFLKKYPGSKIKVISPKAGILTRLNHPNVEAITLPVRFAEYALRTDRDKHIQLLRERLPSFIKQNLKPGAFVLYDLTTLDKAGMEVDRDGKSPGLRPSSEFHRALHQIGATAIGLSNLNEGYIFLGLAALEVNAPVTQIRPELWAVKDSTRLRTNSGQIVGISLRKPVDLGSKNVYQSWLYNLAVLFGSQAYLRWDSRYFVNAQEDGKIVYDFLKDQGLDPEKPYVFLNLNTFGRDKVRELTPVYASVLIEVMTYLRKNYPGLNILASFPEVQFGPEVQEDLLGFRGQHRGEIALVPSSMREVQSAIVQGARWVISYDSGLAHLSSFRSPQEVLTVSLNAGASHIWRRPDQPFIKLNESQAPTNLAGKIIEWIDQHEGRREP